MKVWQRVLGAVLLVILLPIFGIMLHNINHYYWATKCDSASTVSRSCIAYVPVTIVKEQKKEEVSACYNGNCSDHNEYVITAKTQTGKKVTVSVGQSRKDLRIGDSAEIISWNGDYIGINGHNKTSYDYGWHPQLAKTALIFSITLLIIFGIVLAWDVFEASTGGRFTRLTIKIQDLAQHASSAVVWIPSAIVCIVIVFTVLEGLFMDLLV